MAISISEVDETLKKVIEMFSDTENTAIKSNIEVYKTLKQVIELFSDSDKLSDQLLEENNAKDSSKAESFKEEIDDVIEFEGELRDGFYDLISPFYNCDNLYEFPLHQLEQEMCKVIRTEQYNLVGLLQGLQKVRRNLVTICEKVIPLMKKMNMKVPIDIEMRFKRNEETEEEIMTVQPPIVKPPPPAPPEKLLPVKKGHKVVFKRNVRSGVLTIRPPKPIARAPAPEKAGTSTSTLGGRLDSLDNAGDVAFHMYGFPANIGWEIQESMDYRKLIKNERRFDEDEAAIMSFLDDDQEKDPDIWVRVRMLKLRFKELKKKIFGKKNDEPEPKMLGASTAAARGTAAAVKVNRPGPEIVKATFRRVLRNWVFHIEDVLFNFIIYELYYMLVRNNRAEAIFQEFGGKLRELREIYQKMVPITVHKTIYMLENPMGFEFNGDGRENLDKTLGLETMMDQIHAIMLRLMGILTTAGLSSVDKFTPEDEAAKYEETLEQIEEETREIVQKINWEKLPRDV